jgi:siroheme synthase
LAGGEEAEALVAEGIACETVPGISAAQGASASTGIPLTHRDHTGMLVFATGHLQGEGEERSVALDWAALARPRQTVVIYMGVGTLPVICTSSSSTACRVTPRLPWSSAPPGPTSAPLSARSKPCPRSA